jgi:hypothetical protein
MIQGLRKVLGRIAAWEEVQGIIPGRIEKAKQKGAIQLRISYETLSGLKAIARGGGTVQEVFFITDETAKLQERLSREGYI